MKTEIRANFISQLRTMIADTEFIVQHVALDEPEQYVTAHSIMQKGQYISKCKCAQCGHEYVVNEASSSYYYNSRFNCPTCGNNKVITKPGICDRSKQKFHKYIHKTDNGFKFFIFTQTDKFDHDEDWYDKAATVELKISRVGIFDKKYGFFIAEREFRGDFKVFRRNSSDESHAIYWLKDYTNSNMEKEECEKYLKEANDFYAKQRAESQAKSDTRRAKKEEAERLAEEARQKAEAERQEAHRQEMLKDIRCQYKPKEIDISKHLRYPIFGKLYSYDESGKTTHIVHCAKCGADYETKKMREDMPFTCKCGNHVDAPNMHRGDWHTSETQKLLVFENTNLPDNDLLVRIFEYYVATGRQSTSETINVESSVIEKSRVFISDKMRRYYQNSNDGVFDNQTQSYQNYFEYAGELTQTKEEICDIIKNSALKYSGLLEAWGIGNYTYKWHIDMPDMRYLRAWCANHNIEIVMKSNLDRITDYFIDNVEDMKPGKALHEIIGVDKSLIKYIVAEDMQYHAAIDMQSMFELDRTMTPEIYNEMLNSPVANRYYRDIARDFGIPYTSMLQYLQSAYDHQCIDKSDAISVWYDYLNMASKIGVDLNDKSKRFPSSLKKEHDVAVFAYRAIKIQIDNQTFAAQAKINAGLYDFKYKGLMAIVPQTPQEIIEEAQAQKNCLRSYIERVRNGNTVVVFVRRKDDPEKTFLSAEIYDGKLTQLKGYCNSNPRSKEINEFVKKWSERAGFSVDC